MSAAQVSGAPLLSSSTLLTTGNRSGVSFLGSPTWNTGYSQITPGRTHEAEFAAEKIAG
jgi:hypothetical protein